MGRGINRQLIEICTGGVKNRPERLGTPAGAEAVYIKTLVSADERRGTSAERGEAINDGLMPRKSIAEETKT